MLTFHPMHVNMLTNIAAEQHTVLLQPAKAMTMRVRRGPVVRHAPNSPLVWYPFYSTGHSG